MVEAPVATQTKQTKELSETDGHTNWHWMNIIAQKCSTETESVCFQFKFILRLTTTTAFLKKIEKQESELCTFCNENIKALCIFSVNVHTQANNGQYF